ncbi:unnamed protein product [Clonostachys byssicola]|uniref:Protein kinase domain-containing protein n=1 Tax=Clonostachys byssicola TaxID=160290 RepID=A0A9N9UAP0_9HYPO|nr:unnamed protein product [Clonostachys byssicola]
MSDPDISMASLHELVRGSQLPTTFESNGQLIIHARSARRRAAQEKWIIRKRLGSGGQAYIDLQERISAGSGSPQLRAVKNLKIPDGRREGSRELYRRELEAIAKFSQAKYSDHFVTSFGWFLSSQFIHIAMEYCELGDLDKYLCNPSNCPDRRLPKSEVHEISSQILEGLDIMHRESFCHRDLKLANILIMSTSPSWWVKLADFGLTKRIEATMPETTAIRGTPNYMPPELLGYNGNANKADQYAVDMWCLGQCVFRLFTGIPIFASPNHLFQYSHGEESFPELPLQRCDASKSLIDYIKQLVAVDPGERLSSANALNHPWVTSGYSNDEPNDKRFSQDYFTEEDTEASAAWPEDSSDDVEPRESRQYGSEHSPEFSVDEPSAVWPADETAETAFVVENTEPGQEVPLTLVKGDLTATWEAGETVRANLSTDRGGQDTDTAIIDDPTPNKVLIAENHKLSGNGFYGDKNFDKAVEEYSKAIELFPSSPTYLGNRAAALMSNGKYQEALIDCFKALQVAPDSRKLLVRLVHIYTALGEADKAVHWLKLISNPEPTEEEAMAAKAMHRDHKLAMDLIGQSETTSIESMQLVISALDRARKYQSLSARLPWDWQVTLALAHLNLNGLELDTEKRAASLERAQTAIDSIRDSDEYYHSEAIFLYGRLLYCQGQDENAIQTLERATRASSYCFSEERCVPCRDGIRWLGIARELSQLKEQGNNAFRAHDWITAKDFYNRALKVDPTNRLTNAKLYQNRARCYIRLGFYYKAIDDCTKAIDLDPTYVKAQATKATATGLSGYLGGALEEWKLVRKMSPGDSQAIKNIRSLESELADPQRATLDERKAKYGADHSLTIQAMEALVDSLCNQELHQEAVVIQKEILEIEVKRAGTKKNERVLSVMGNICCNLSLAEKYQEALPICREVFELRQDHSGLENAATLASMHDLGSVMVSLKQYADAEPLFIKALSLSEMAVGDTDEITVGCKEHLAMIYIEESRLEEAFFHLQDVLEWKKKYDGEEDLSTVRVMHDIGNVLNQLGRASEAEPLLRDAVRLRTKELGTNHERTQESVKALSSTLAKLWLSE